MLNPALLEETAAHPVAASDPPPQKSFIETQFPVSLLSKECYKERKAGAGQTLTALGSYWKGRKPLILVRACILGCLLPATDDPKRDREIFLKLMLMDAEGLRKRWRKSIPAATVLEKLGKSNCAESIEDDKWRRGVAQSVRADLQERAFRRMTYDEKLQYCLRPEEMPLDAWDDIWPMVNRHLHTSAGSVAELVDQLGKQKFGHRPRVADTFCGGGSIPFEAARMGCDVHASDLNPIAAMLTWGALNVIGGNADVTAKLSEAQHAIAAAVRQKIDNLGIEENGSGWRGKVYLYCLEVRCPQTGWMIPLAPSWVISESHSVIARLVPNEQAKRFEIEIVSGVSKQQLEAARQGTIRDGFVCHPNDSRIQIPLKTIRGDGQAEANAWGNCLRLWSKEDFAPRPDDIYQERLYCIQWTREEGGTEFRSVSPEDLHREQLVRDEVAQNLARWQEEGLVPDSTIESGYNTDQPIKERGWTHWHHLFQPRQLLTLALYKQEIDRVEDPTLQAATGILFCRILAFASRLCRWDTTRDQSANVFYNQALNTLSNFATRSATYISGPFTEKLAIQNVAQSHHSVAVHSAAEHSSKMDLFLTDPPYGDAVNYEEITEFFIAWMRRNPPRALASWKWDSRRLLAVKGNGKSFRRSMAEAYAGLTRNMSETGIQLVMFTHSDISVWGELARIFWAADLQVTAAWCIGTEATTGFRDGNHVQGTHLLLLRRRTGTENAWSNKLGRKLRSAVEVHLERMMKLDDREQPNFGDADYQLAAYAAALGVLTQYETLDGEDVAVNLLKDYENKEKSTIEKLLDTATRAASDFLIPRNLNNVERNANPNGLSGKEIWGDCSAEERFYLKGLEIECKSETRVGAFQEIARGFGVDDYKVQMAAVKANVARLKTACEWKGTNLILRNDKTANELMGFGSSVTRHALYGIYLAMEEQDLRPAIERFEKFMPEYWDRRKRLLGILEYLGTASTPNRVEEARWARDLAGAVFHHGS